MSSEVGEGRPAKLPALANGTRQSEPENLPCPRCDSTNTKFCYYNNYNLSQPRHFCKNCRRYWTRGGTLRNIPVGGGTRKNSSHKRPRTATPQDPVNATPVSSVSGQVFGSGQISSTGQLSGSNQVPGFVQAYGSGQGSGSMSLMGCEVNLNESVQESGGANGSFTSLLGGPVGGGFVPLGGFGLGLGGFGLEWPMEQVVRGGDGGGNDKWQLSSGEIVGGGGGGGGADDCFGWPDDLAISAPGRDQS